MACYSRETCCIKKYQKKLAKYNDQALQAYKEANSSMRIVESSHKPLYSSTPDSLEALIIADLKKDLLGSETDNRVHFYFVDTEEVNAATTPRGNIYLYKGLLRKMYDSWVCLLGVCAHELAHYFLHHAELNIYNDLREERKATAWTVTLLVLSAASSATSHLYPTSETPAPAKDYAKEFEETYNSMQAYSKLAHFEYSRGEEYEADIVAYRFLEYIGLNPMSLVTMLERLGNEYDSYYNKYSDHPTISSRIDLMKLINRSYPLKSLLSKKAKDDDDFD